MSKAMSDEDKYTARHGRHAEAARVRTADRMNAKTLAVLYATFALALAG